MVSTKPKLQLSEQHLPVLCIPLQVFGMYDLKVTYNITRKTMVEVSAKSGKQEKVGEKE